MMAQVLLAASYGKCAIMFRSSICSVGKDVGTCLIFTSYCTLTILCKVSPETFAISTAKINNELPSA